MPPLDVIIVNSQSTTPPEHADTLAQANLDKGGEHAKQQEVAPSPKPAEKPNEKKTVAKLEQLSQKAEQAAGQLALKGMVNPKDYLTGSPMDAEIINRLIDMKDKGLEYLSTKGATGSGLQIVMAKPMADLLQYSTTAKMAKNALDQGISKFGAESGYDKAALYNQAKKIFFLMTRRVNPWQRSALRAKWSHPPMA